MGPVCLRSQDRFELKSQSTLCAGDVKANEGGAVDELNGDRVKQFPCAQCDSSFSVRTNLRRHVKKAHFQPLWRPLPSVTGRCYCWLPRGAGGFGTKVNDGSEVGAHLAVVGLGSK